MLPIVIMMVAVVVRTMVVMILYRASVDGGDFY